MSNSRSGDGVGKGSVVSEVSISMGVAELRGCWTVDERWGMSVWVVVELEDEVVERWGLEVVGDEIGVSNGDAFWGKADEGANPIRNVACASSCNVAMVDHCGGNARIRNSGGFRLLKELVEVQHGLRLRDLELIVQQGETCTCWS